MRLSLHICVQKTFISLFGGIGGFDLALTDRGWECLNYVEIDSYACEIYNKNFGTSYAPQDIKKIHELPKHTLLCAGFPCQAFSTAGMRRGFADARGTLFFEIVRLVRRCRPKILVLENVKGLLNHEEGFTFKVILRELDGVGYDVEWQVLNSKDFGVPQNRERIYIVGHLREGCRRQVFPFEGSSSSDAQDRRLPIERVYYSRNQHSRIYGTGGISPTIQTGTIPVVLVAQNPFTMVFHYPDPERRYLSNLSMRKLTPVECERLQGFPDGWTEGVSDTQRYKQLGNAVTVPVIEALVSRIERAYGLRLEKVSK